MQKPPQKRQQIQYLQYETLQDKNMQPSQQQSNTGAQDQNQVHKDIVQARQQYFYLKMILSVILVILATTSVQTQMQYYGPFIRTVQCFFNYHLMLHTSQDIYQGTDVIFWKTQEFVLKDNIMSFFTNYLDTMDTFHNNSFFYQNNTNGFKNFKKNINEQIQLQTGKQRQFSQETSRFSSDKQEIIEILIVHQSTKSNQVKKYKKDIIDKFNMKQFGSKDFYEQNNYHKTNGNSKIQKQNNFLNVLTGMMQKEDEEKQNFQQKQSQNSQQLHQSSFSTSPQQQILIVSLPLSSLRDYFQATVFQKQYYKLKIKKMQITTNLYIKFKQGVNCVVEVKVIAIFNSLNMMTTKVLTNVLDEEMDYNLNRKNNGQGNIKDVDELSKKLQNTSGSSSQEQQKENLKIRKISSFHNLTGLNFQQMGYIIFIINGILFCLQLMVIIRTNDKIQQNIQQQVQFQKKMFQLGQYQKRKQSRDLKAKNANINNSDQSQQNHDNSYLSSQDASFQGHIHLKLNQKDDIESFLGYHINPNKLSYGERLKIIGIYSILELILSFLVLITVQHKGLVCFFCWAKISIYLSQTGNRMMIGFLFKKAIPFFLKVIANVSIWLSGFVFFSMVVYQSTKKFQTVQLSYYQYLFNYFQYGIYQNFQPIQKYGPFYTCLYFIQMAFLVMLGNNILQSILAQQVLKNSNMQSLTDIIESIEVQCPVCGCPPQVKKKIKVKLNKQHQRENQFISKYFQQNKEIAKKSRYQIKILSPQFSPMFHKSQIRKKDYKLKKRTNNLISIVGQQSILNSPPGSPKSPYSPLLPTSLKNRALSPPNFPQSPIRGPISPLILQGQPIQPKKKVLIQIGGDIQQKSTRKLQKYSKLIITKTQIINKLILDVSFSKSKQPAAITRTNKQFYIQGLKKRLEQIKKIIQKVNNSS